MPARALNEAQSFVSQGLQDVSLTRAKLTWGVTVPWDPSHVFYVWFDALLNYYTALSYARPGEDLTDRYWPATLHVIGKDILKFHTIYWPALLLAADLALPKHVFVHGFLLGADGRKMSKSLGNVLDPFEVLDSFGTDALRFYLMREVSFGGDGPVGMDAVTTRYESELANEYGNLASRCTAMILRYRDGTVPNVAHRSGDQGRVRWPAPADRGAVRPSRADAGARADLAAGTAAEPLRRGTGAVATGPRPGRCRAARPGARDPARGGPRGQRASPPVHAGERRDAAAGARRALDRLRRRRVRRGGSRLGRRGPAAGAALSEARDDAMIKRH